MASTFVPADRVARIRRRLGAPVIDADGHLVEFMPMVIDCLREVAGADLARRFVEFRRSPFTSGARSTCRPGCSSETHSASTA